MTAINKATMNAMELLAANNIEFLEPRNTQVFAARNSILRDDPAFVATSFIAAIKAFATKS